MSKSLLVTNSFIKKSYDDVEELIFDEDVKMHSVVIDMKEMFPNLKKIVFKSYTGLCVLFNNFYFKDNIVDSICIEFDGYIEAGLLKHLAFITRSFEVVDSQCYTTENGILYNADKKTLVSCPKKKTGAIIIPDGIEEIKADTFAYSQASSITLSKSVNKIGRKCFYRCKDLQHFDFGESNIEIIPEKAFSEIDKLVSIAIPGTVKTIDCCAFYLSTRLKDIVLADGLEEIKTRAFFGTGISNIVLPKTVGYLSRQSLFGVNHVRLNSNPVGLLSAISTHATPSQINFNVTVQVDYFEETRIFPKFVHTLCYPYTLNWDDNMMDIINRGYNTYVQESVALGNYCKNKNKEAKTYISMQLVTIMRKLIRANNIETLITILNDDWPMQYQEAFEVIFEEQYDNLSPDVLALLMKQINKTEKGTERGLEL